MMVYRCLVLISSLGLNEVLYSADHENYLSKIPRPPALKNSKSYDSAKNSLSLGVSPKSLDSLIQRSSVSYFAEEKLLSTFSSEANQLRFLPDWVFKEPGVEDRLDRFKKAINGALVRYANRQLAQKPILKKLRSLKELWAEESNLESLSELVDWNVSMETNITSFERDSERQLAISDLQKRLIEIDDEKLRQDLDLEKLRRCEYPFEGLKVLIQPDKPRIVLKPQFVPETTRLVMLAARLYLEKASDFPGIIRLCPLRFAKPVEMDSPCMEFHHDRPNFGIIIAQHQERHYFEIELNHRGKLKWNYQPLRRWTAFASSSMDKKMRKLKISLIEDANPEIIEILEDLVEHLSETIDSKPQKA